ncbi:MAG: hypothetical protein LBK42_08780 [Propionibacteriaceae bacterium]|jgi:aminomethyltransferase|nr:hypothetical protein [Propionibacteriaceae bacterium]
MDDAKGYQAIRQSVAVYRRGARLVEVTGAQRGQLLTHALAKSTEYAQPGTSLETLALDDDGRPIDLVLVIFEEDRAILVSDVASGVIDQLPALAQSLELTDLAQSELDDWCAIAVEGPSSWRIVEDLVDDDLASMTLNERRPARSPLGDAGILVRTGQTAEYGYLWLGRAEAGPTEAAFLNRALAEGGAEATPDALLRAKLEINHPVFPQAMEGLSLRQAGVEWLAGSSREDDYRGRPAELGEPRSRGLVAVRAPGAELPATGTTVEAGGQPVGSLFLVAPQVGQPDGFALALLDAPFDVPGLDLTAGGVYLRTVSRPAVDPLSWSETVGSSTIRSSAHWQAQEQLLNEQR